MSIAKSEKQWAAVRALREGKPPTLALLARAAGLDIDTIRARATCENADKSAEIGINTLTP